MIEAKIVEYIKTSLAQGKTKEEIYQEFLGQGLSLEAIQENFQAVNIESEGSQEKEDLSKKTISIIVTFGAILVGAGIFSFIASNWQSMDRFVKIAIILVSMLVAYGAGWYLKEKANLTKTGSALILLGVIIYGAGIFLVAQMFNIRANWPDGFILWMIGAIAMAFATKAYHLFYLAIFLGFIALIGHPFIIFINFFGHSPFLLTSSFLLLAATVIVFISGLIIRQKIPAEFKEFY